MTQFDFIELAVENNLEIIDTTSECNGYPRNIQKAIIGFETFEEAESLAKENNLDIEVFEKRDGWNFWYRTGERAFEPFGRSAEDYGDDYKIFTASDQEDFYENEVQSFIGEFENFDSVEDFIKKGHEVYDAICDLEEGEAVVTHEGCLYEVIQLHTMAYSYDTHHYAIGLIDRNEED